MGCGASASAGQLKEARQEADDLRRKLLDAEAEKGDLRRQLLEASQRQALESKPFATATAPASDLEPDHLPPAGEPQLRLAAAGPSPGSPGKAACVEAGGVEGPPGLVVGLPLEGAAASQAHDAGPQAAEDQGEAPSLPGAVAEGPLPVPPQTRRRSHPSQAGCLAVLPEMESIDSAWDRMVTLAREESVADSCYQLPATTELSPILKVDPPASQLAPKETEEASEVRKGQLQPTEQLGFSVGSTASTCTPQADNTGFVSSGGSSAQCHQCGLEGLELFLDPSDLNRYCEQCWADYYGQIPARAEMLPLVTVEVSELWLEDRLAQLWAEHCLPGWPPPVVHSTPSAPSSEGEVWSTVHVRVRREIVGPHAREQNNTDGHPFPGEVLAGRYRVKQTVGEGHFTKAFMAEDLKEGGLVCLKRHRNLSVEALADLMALGHRMSAQDPDGKLFPRLMGSFYDVVGYTVESLLEGRNCLALAQADSNFFRNMGSLRHVAVGALEGLVALDRAGVVHNDVKPDNLIWTEVAVGGGQDRVPQVKIVDFGCARLDMREEPPGRNWSLAEGGAGHLGKWSPEMALRLPITHRGDVWGIAISLCELHSGRFVWRNESDTAEVVLAQSLGLCGLTDGLPASLLRRSPLDIRQLYTPAPKHFPLRQNALGQLEALRPTRWGLEQVLGENWRTNEKAALGELLEAALVVDAAHRPSAADLLESCRFVAPQAPEEPQDQQEPPAPPV